MMKSTKSMMILIGLLLLSSACVRRSTMSPVDPDATDKDVVASEKLIWIWQDEYRNK